MPSREPQRTEIGAIRWPEALKRTNQPHQLALVGGTRRFRRFFRKLLDHAPAANPSRDLSVLAAYRQRFSWAAAGARYRARLEELWGQRRELAGRLKWSVDTAG